MTQGFSILCSPTELPRLFLFILYSIIFLKFLQFFKKLQIFYFEALLFVKSFIARVPFAKPIFLLLFCFFCFFFAFFASFLQSKKSKKEAKKAKKKQKKSGVAWVRAVPKSPTGESKSRQSHLCYSTALDLLLCKADCTAPHRTALRMRMRMRMQRQNAESYA